MLRALIFNVDGTLADTERDRHRVAFTAPFRAEIDCRRNVPRLLRDACPARKQLHE